MQSVERATVVGFDKGCRTDVGVDHGLLNDLVRLQSGNLQHARNVTLFNVDNTVAAVEIQSAALVLSMTKRLMYFRQCPYGFVYGSAVLVLARQRRLVIDICLDLFIGESTVRSN